MVWPTPFLTKMLTALKGFQFYFYLLYDFLTIYAKFEVLRLKLG